MAELPDQATIAWTRPMLERFKVAWACADGKNFTFDGYEFDSRYAKYLIEHLDANLAPTGGENDG